MKTLHNTVISLAMFILLFLTSCSSSSESTSPKQEAVESSKYEVVDEQRSSGPTKVRLIEYAVYKDSIYTKDSLKNVLLALYNKNRDLFADNNIHAVYGAYLFGSKEMAIRDKSGWIAMLIKTSRDSIPVLTYNDMKIQSLQGLNDTVKSEDEIAYDKLKKYLVNRNLELCSLYLQLGDMELDCIHKADTLYPNFGIEHDKYSEKLMDDERKKLAKKYNLADSIFVRVAVFGMSYCK